MIDRLAANAWYLLFTSAADALLIVDAAAAVVLANAAAGRLFGRPHQDIAGLPLEALLAPQCREEFRVGLAEYRADPSRRRLGPGGTLSGQRPDAGEFAASIRLSPIEDGLTLANVQDMTEHRRASEALRKFSRVIEQTASTVVITDADGVIEYVNPRFSEISGYSAEEAIGKQPRLLKSGHTPADEYRQMWETISGGRVWQGEFLNRRKDGSLYWESAIISPVRDGQGRITHYVGIKDDISDRKRAELAMAEREAQYRAVIETAGDGFWMLDGEGRLLAVNDAYVHRSGYSREELVGMRIADLDANETPEDVRAHVAKVKRQGSDLFETRHRAKDGEIWPVEVHASYSAGAGGLFFAFSRDITERRRTEAELQALRAEMEQFTQFHVASQTVAAIAHELNQPLNAITSYNEAALRFLRAGNPKPDRLRHAIERSAQQAKRAGRVMRELLAFMRQGEVLTESFNLNELVRRVLARLDVDGHGACRLRLEPDPGLAPVGANRLQVEKVLANLVENGIEAMAGVGIDARHITVVVRTGSEAGMAQVTVADSGPGIDATTLHRIFDPFFTTKPKGLGMGLAISRAIVESHGGRLWVESEPGAGAAFHFTLPFAA